MSFYLQCFFSILCIFSLYSNPKIYDCIPFFNELEVLEIRLNELYDHVDHFVIVEASEGFSGIPKPYRLEQNWNRFKRFHDKIRYIKVGKIWATGPHPREHWQKIKVSKGLYDCKKEDIVFIADLDEIPDPKTIPDIIKELETEPVVVLEHKQYRHFLNRTTERPGWEHGQALGLVAVKAKYLEIPHLKQVRWCTNDVRMSIVNDGSWPEKFPGLQRVKHIQSGWHFTSMGGFKKFRQKVKNWSHCNNPHPTTSAHWLAEVKGHPLVPIDESFPKYIQNNIDYLIQKGLIDTSSE